MCMEWYHTQLNVCMREKGPPHCIAVQISPRLTRFMATPRLKLPLQSTMD